MCSRMINLDVNSTKTLVKTLVMVAFFGKNNFNCKVFYYLNDEDLKKGLISLKPKTAYSKKTHFKTKKCTNCFL